MKKSTNQNSTSLVTQSDLEEWGITLTDRIDGLETNISSRMDGLEGRMDGLEGRMDGLEGRMDGLEGRMDDIDKKVTEMNDKMMTYFDKILGKLENLETDNEVGTDQYRNHQIRLDSHEKRIQKLESA